MMNSDKAIAAAVKTGKTSFGAKSTIKAVQTGKTKLVILTTDCPEKVRSMIEHHCSLSNIPLLNFNGSSFDLATVCGKPFNISSLSIKEPGESKILSLIREMDA